MRSDADAKRQIIEIANDLFASGHLTPTGGNISARAADDDKIWITPSQLYKGSLTADTLLCIREDGSLVECEGKPSVEFQMHCAKAFDKPIIVLEPFGGADTISPAVQELADDVVPWDQRQLADSIKRQARHEETMRFDTIEFKLD